MRLRSAPSDSRLTWTTRAPQGKPARNSRHGLVRTARRRFPRQTNSKHAGMRRVRNGLGLSCGAPLRSKTHSLARKNARGSPYPRRRASALGCSRRTPPGGGGIAESRYTPNPVRVLAARLVPDRCMPFTITGGGRSRNPFGLRCSRRRASGPARECSQACSSDSTVGSGATTRVILRPTRLELPRTKTTAVSRAIAASRRSERCWT